MKRLGVLLLAGLFLVLFLLGLMLTLPGRTLLDDQAARNQWLPALVELLAEPAAWEAERRIRVPGSPPLLHQEELTTMIRECFAADLLMPDLQAFYRQLEGPAAWGRRSLVIDGPGVYDAFDAAVVRFRESLAGRLAGKMDEVRLGELLRQYQAERTKVRQRVSEELFQIPVFSLLSLARRHRRLVNLGVWIVVLLPLAALFSLCRARPRLLPGLFALVLSGPVFVVALLVLSAYVGLHFLARSEFAEWTALPDFLGHLAWWSFGPPTVGCAVAALLCLIIARPGLRTPPQGPALPANIEGPPPAGPEH